MGIIFVLSFYQKFYLHCSCLVIERTGFIQLSLFHSLIPRLLSCVRFRTSSTGGLTSLSTTIPATDTTSTHVTSYPASNPHIYIPHSIQICPINTENSTQKQDAGPFNQAIE